MHAVGSTCMQEGVAVVSSLICMGKDLPCCYVLEQKAAKLGQLAERGEEAGQSACWCARPETLVGLHWALAYKKNCVGPTVWA